MTSSRTISTSIWQDNFFYKFTSDEKFLFMYLLTNNFTNNCGIFRIHKEFIQLETGFNVKTIDKLLNNFVEYGRMLYAPQNNEIMIIDALKYTNSKNITIQRAINKELKDVKTVNFLDVLYDQCLEIGIPVDIIFKNIKLK